MEGLVEPNRLRARILMWAEEEARIGNLPPKAGAILVVIACRPRVRPSPGTIAQARPLRTTHRGDSIVSCEALA